MIRYIKMLWTSKVKAVCLIFHTAIIYLALHLLGMSTVNAFFDQKDVISEIPNLRYVSCSSWNVMILPKICNVLNYNTRTYPRLSCLYCSFIRLSGSLKVGTIRGLVSVVRFWFKYILILETLDLNRLWSYLPFWI